MNMKKINSQHAALTQRIRDAKPVREDDSRAKMLLLEGQTKSSLKFKAAPTVRRGAAIILTPLVLALVVFLLISPTKDTPTLSLYLKNFNEKQVSTIGGTNSSVIADCATVNTYCNDVGILSQTKIDWQLSLSEDVADETDQGHVYRLQGTDDAVQIANLLASEFEINQKIKTSHESNGYDYFEAGSRKQKFLSISTSKALTSIEYHNPHAGAWYGCQHNYIPEGVDCASTVFEDIPTNEEAIAYTKNLLAKMGVRGGTDLQDLNNGDYLIKTFSLNSGKETTHMGTRSQLVIDGFATSTGGHQIMWTIGSKQVESVSATLHKLTDLGSFSTLTSSDSYNRLNGYITYGSFKESDPKLSNKSREGMPQEELERLYELMKSQKDQTSVKVSVKLTKAEPAPVTIIDSGRMSWIVPGYNFYDDTGYFGSVMSLDSSYIQMDSGNK